MSVKNWIAQNILKRKLIKNNEDKISYIQLVGFLLIGIGIIYMTFFRIHNHYSSGEGMAIAFFIIMLGMSFAFPSLLQGQDKDLSTMRIVVFMMVNVICLLLIKIGWSKEVKSLKDIGLDQYWMGVIAFVFGAKVAQSYFESKLAVPNEVSKIGTANLEYSNSDIAKLALIQNEQFLKVKFPNIVSVSDTVYDLDHTDSHVIALYLKDNNTVGIPDRLEVKMPNGNVKTIATEIVSNIGEAKINISQNDSIADINSPNYLGSICCVVKSLNNEDFTGIITAAHIYSNGNYNDDNNDVLPISLQGSVLINDVNQGNWFYKEMTDSQDLIIIKLIDTVNLDADFPVFNNQYYTISDLDVKNEKMKVIVSAKNNKLTNAFILDYGVGLPIKYSNGDYYKKNIILIGSKPTRIDSIAVSAPGDSGGCVYMTNENNVNKLVGIILGSNDKFTFVLPIESTLNSNFKII